MGREDCLAAVIYSLTETKTETEMFHKTETKYKRKSERTKRNSIETKMILKRKWLQYIHWKKTSISVLRFDFFS